MTYVAINLKRFDHYEQFVVDGADIAPVVDDMLAEAPDRVDDREWQRRDQAR